jgi:hypothetical protein
VCVCSIVPDRCFCWLLLLILTDSVCSQTHLSHMAGLPCVVATGAGLWVRRVPDPRPEHAAPHRDLLWERPAAHPHDTHHAAHQQGQDGTVWVTSTHTSTHTNKARTVQCESPLHTPTRPGRYSVSRCHHYTVHTPLHLGFVPIGTLYFNKTFEDPFLVGGRTLLGNM